MSIERLRLLIVFICILLLGVFILKKKQNIKLNWALFYAGIWIFISLPIVNYICVELNFWEFTALNNSIKIPFDILFIWAFLWILPVYFFKGEYLRVITLALLWVDILFMPQLEDYGLLRLSENWLIGEIILLVLVFIPSYLWAKFSIEKKQIAFRTLMQVLTMSLFLLILIPFTVKIFENDFFEFNGFSTIWFQIIFIIAFPSFIAVIDLVDIGNGTPFPYDKTENLVTSGVFAYIKNPIQWSFTMLFIPLSIYHQSFLLLMGFVISIFYALGVSNPQEYEDMKERFGQKWVQYKVNTPSWCFLWKPKTYPKGTIYFKRNCNQCEGIKKWFDKKKGLNLKIDYAASYKGEALLQVTYVLDNNKEYKSVKAIAHALSHINLGYASLGWFMRFPIVTNVLQVIVDALGFSDINNNINCKNKL